MNYKQCTTLRGITADAGVVFYTQEVCYGTNEVGAL
jgi:hypothetical protein